MSLGHREGGSGMWGMGEETGLGGIMHGPSLPLQTQPIRPDWCAQLWKDELKFFLLLILLI